MRFPATGTPSKFLGCVPEHQFRKWPYVPSLLQKLNVRPCLLCDLFEGETPDLKSWRFLWLRSAVLLQIDQTAKKYLVETIISLDELSLFHHCHQSLKSSTPQTQFRKYGSNKSSRMAHRSRRPFESRRSAHAHSRAWRDCRQECCRRYQSSRLSYAGSWCFRTAVSCHLWLRRRRRGV